MCTLTCLSGLEWQIVESYWVHGKAPDGTSWALQNLTKSCLLKLVWKTLQFTVEVQRKGSFRKNGSTLMSSFPQGTDKVNCLICKQVSSLLKECHVKCHHGPITNPTASSCQVQDRIEGKGSFSHSRRRIQSFYMSLWFTINTGYSGVPFGLFPKHNGK